MRTPLLRSLAGRLSVAAVGIGLLVAIAAAIILVRTRSAVTDLERGIYAQLATDARLRLDRLVGRDRTRLMETAFADEIYDLVARGPAPPDSFVRPSFTDRFVNLHGDRFIGLYDLTGKRLFVYGNAPEIESAATAAGFLRTLDNREPNVGLLRAGENLYWVAGAPVLPTNYADATKPIRGYLVVAQPFGPTTLAAGASERGARLELSGITAPKEAFRTRVDVVAGDSVRIDFALPDVFAQQTTLASLTTSRSEFRALDGTFRGLWVLALAVAGLIGLVIWLAATRLLVSPAVRTSAALAPVHRGEVPNLVNAPLAVNEWTAMVGAVNRLIANGRTAAERFERMTGAVTEGAFEIDLNSREWTTGSRFNQLLGIGKGDDVIDALSRTVHPEDVDRLVPWLTAESPTPRRLAVDVRLRRAQGAEWWTGRIEAEVGTDLSGQPVRITGRLADVSSEHAREEERRGFRTQWEDRARGEGAFLIELAAALRGGSDTETIAAQLALLGEASTGRLTWQAEPFDLLALMQDVATAAPGPTELAVVPGVSTTVRGDAAVVRALVTNLLALADRTAGPVTLRAEPADKARADLIRLVVEDRRTAPADRLAGVLERGDRDPTALGAAVIHQVARALDGKATVSTEGPLTRLAFEIPLPAVVVAAPPPAEGWDEAAGDESTFETERASEPTPPARPSGRVELVADATVVIDLDAPAPDRGSPVAQRVLDALAARDSAVLRTARIALADTPIRIAELKGAIRAGESRTVSQIAQAVRTIADALDARELASRAGDLLDAVEGQYLESAEHLAHAVDAAWTDVRLAIAPFMDLPERPRAAGSAIEAATLEQLTATTTSDGLGLGNQLIGLFLAEAPARLDTAERAAANGDLVALRSAVSDLRGMCGLIGATRLAGACAGAAEPGQGADLDRLIATLRSELRLVQDVLEPLLGVRAGA